MQQHLQQLRNPFELAESEPVDVLILFSGLGAMTAVVLLILRELLLGLVASGHDVRHLTAAAPEAE